MKKLDIKTNPKVDEIFTNYPDFVQYKMKYLRKPVIETAEEIEGITRLEETLKWGEPSFITKSGSTLRMDWKEKNPDQYAMYFQCTTRLVETFRIVFNHKFKYEGNRAIVFQINQKIPVLELKECIKAALTYHKVKHLTTIWIPGNSNLFSRHIQFFAQPLLLFLLLHNHQISTIQCLPLAP